jgi:hypothetical protein
MCRQFSNTLTKNKNFNQINDIMKTIANILLVVLLLVTIPSFGQGNYDASAQCKAEMNKLSYFVGDWEGQASYRSGQGPAQILSQKEHIEWNLDGVILSIEGIGRKDDVVQFNAYAIINFDPYAKVFKFKSYTKEGRSTEAYFRILKENNFEWGFDIPSGGKVRFTIVLDPLQKSWSEIGEYSQDGNTWFKTTELNLKKVD